MHIEQNRNRRCPTRTAIDRPRNSTNMNARQNCAVDRCHRTHPQRRPSGEPFFSSRRSGRSQPSRSTVPLSVDPQQRRLIHSTCKDHAIERGQRLQRNLRRADLRPDAPEIAPPNLLLINNRETATSLLPLVFLCQKADRAPLKLGRHLLIFAKNTTSICSRDQNPRHSQIPSASKCKLKQSSLFHRSHRR